MIQDGRDGELDALGLLLVLDQRTRCRVQDRIEPVAQDEPDHDPSDRARCRRRGPGGLGDRQRDQGRRRPPARAARDRPIRYLRVLPASSSVGRRRESRTSTTRLDFSSTMPTSRNPPVEGDRSEQDGSPIWRSSSRSERCRVTGSQARRRKIGCIEQPSCFLGSEAELGDRLSSFEALDRRGHDGLELLV